MHAEPATYVDTSALAKWYVRERGSDEFENWIRAAADPTVSSLTVVEMRCLLARRRRSALLDADAEQAALDVFHEHIAARLLSVEPVNDVDVRTASHVMGRLSNHALRALDALHLTICTARSIPQMATADAVMAAAAEQLGMVVIRFD